MKNLLIFISLIYLQENFSQTFQWVKSIPCSDEIDVKKIISVDDNSFLLTGNYKGSINFDSQVISSIGDSDFFMSKHDSIGNLIWIKSFGGFDDIEIQDLALSSNKDVFICGTFEGSVLIDTILLTNPTDKNAFLARLDSNGNVLWAKNFESTSDVEANAISFNKLNDKLSFVAVYEDDVLFDTINQPAFGNSSLFFSVFNIDGSCDWYTEVSSQDEIEASSLEYDSIGNIYCLGNFEGNIFFQSNVISNISNKDLFLMKTDSTGNLIWFKSVGGSDDVEAAKLVIYDTCLILIGKFSGTANFQNTSISSSGDEDGFLLNLSFDNAENWIATFASNDEVSPKDIDVDVFKNIYVTGSIKSDTYFGNVVVQNNSGEDLFFCKYNSNGNFQWVKSVGGSEDVKGISISLNNENDLLFSGNFEGSAFFDSFTLSALSDKDGFLGKLSTDSIFVVSINSKTTSSNLNVYPNPTYDQITLEMEEGYNGSINVEVYDLTGKFLKTTTNTTISMGEYAKGIYILKVSYGEKTKEVRVVRDY